MMRFNNINSLKSTEAGIHTGSGKHWADLSVFLDGYYAEL